jgi:hypothetical protein
MEEAPENSKESPHSGHVNEMNERMMFQFGDFLDMEMQKSARSVKLSLLLLKTSCSLGKATSVIIEVALFKAYDRTKFSSFSKKDSFCHMFIIQTRMECTGIHCLTIFRH